MLFFTASRSRDGLRQLKTTVDHVYRNSAYPVSRTLLIRRSRTWAEYRD
jgi:hypothetical protein